MCPYALRSIYPRWGPTNCECWLLDYDNEAFYAAVEDVNQGDVWIDLRLLVLQVSRCIEMGSMEGMMDRESCGEDYRRLSGGELLLSSSGSGSDISLFECLCVYP